MTLFSMCMDVMSKPEVLLMHKNQLSEIPVDVKNELLRILFKRDYINVYVFKELIHSNVIVMDLSDCNVTDDLLSCLSVCKRLQKLDLSVKPWRSRCISNRVLNSLFLNLPSLYVLTIPFCEEVNDETVDIISENCKQLEELHIPGSSISDVSLYCLGENLVCLSVIDISYTKVSDKGIRYLINGGLAERLTVMKLDSCPFVVYSGRIIANKCPNMEIFSCECCGNREIELAIEEKHSRAKDSWYV